MHLSKTTQRCSLQCLFIHVGHGIKEHQFRFNCYIFKGHVVTATNKESRYSSVIRTFEEESTIKYSYFTYFLFLQETQDKKMQEKLVHFKSVNSILRLSENRFFPFYVCVSHCSYFGSCSKCKPINFKSLLVFLLAFSYIIVDTFSCLCHIQ